MKLKCCYGISSRTNNNNEHVLFFDYDNNNIKPFTEYLLYLQKNYYLSDIYIIKSKNGYNAVCLDKIPFYFIMNISNNILNPCDRAFYKAGINRGYFTLRFDYDKQLDSILKTSNCFYTKSLAHKLFLEWFFDIEINSNNFDNNHKITIIQYPSTKNGYHLVDKKIPDYFTFISEEKK